MSNKRYTQGEALYIEGMSLTKISKELKVSRKHFTDYLASKGYDTTRNSTKYTFDRDYFKTIDSERKMYWLGFITADGCILLNSKQGKLKGKVLEITLASKDSYLLYAFCTDLHLDTSCIKDKTVVLNKKQFKAKRLSVCSTALCNDLIALGITPRKSLTAAIDTDIKNHKHLNAYIRGYVDGNGHVHKDKHGISIHAGTQDLLAQIRDSLTNIGCTPRNVNSKNAYNHTLHYYKKSDEQLIYDYLYTDATIFLERKRQPFIARSTGNCGTGGGKIGRGV